MYPAYDLKHLSPHTNEIQHYYYFIAKILFKCNKNRSIRCGIEIARSEFLEFKGIPCYNDVLI